MLTQTNEVESFQLDETFKDNLALIRPHIQSIKSITDANLCRIWLEKLSETSMQEKEMRNVYICALRSQVESGELQPPFDNPPPEGPLVTFAPTRRNEEHDQLSCSSWSDLTAHRGNGEESSANSEADDSSLITLHTDNSLSHNFDCIKNYGKNKTEDKAHYKQAQQAQQALSLFLSKNNKDGETFASIGQVKNIFENKIESLKSIIKNLQEENARLKEDAERSQQNEAVTCEWNLFRAEIDVLKSKLTDVQNSKIVLEENHKEVLVKYQQEMGVALSHLCHRLNEAQMKNRNVEMKLEVALDQLQKLHVQSELRSNITKDTEKQESTTEKFGDANKTIINLKTLLAVKSEEVRHLEEALKTQCYKMQKEVNFIKDGLKNACESKNKKIQAKVCELQKIVDKHSRNKAKLLKNCKYKMNCLAREKHLELKGLELQLHTQRAEIVAAVSKEKQKQLEVEVCKLEERYKEVLVETEKKYNVRQEHDEKRINQLESELSALLLKLNNKERPPAEPV